MYVGEVAAQGKPRNSNYLTPLNPRLEGAAGRYNIKDKNTFQGLHAYFQLTAFPWLGFRESIDFSVHIYFYIHVFRHLFKVFVMKIFFSYKILDDLHLIKCQNSAKTASGMRQKTAKISQSLPPRIRYRDAPNCVHGIGFCAKKNDFNFRNFVGNILANMQQFCLLEEKRGGGILQSYWKKNNSWKAKENRNGKA